MKLFLDTEFTGLHKETTLISIGMVSENGQTFYAELTDYNQNQVDDWIQANVISKLKFTESTIDKEGWFFSSSAEGSIEGRGTKAQVREVLNQWLAQFESVEVVSDCGHFDFVLFLDLVADHVFQVPPHIAPVYQDINQDLMVYYDCEATVAFNMSRELLCEYMGANLPTEEKHNALYDAYVIKEIYEFLHEEPNEY